MPINFFSSINLDTQEIQDVALENLATAAQPSGVSGQIYYNTTDNEIRFFNGTAWLALAAASGGVTTFTNEDGAFVSAGTVNTSATGAVTMGIIDLSATGTSDATTFLRGDNTWATPAGSYTSWSLEGGSGTPVDITDGLRVDFTGGTYITTTVASATPNTLTVAHNATARTDTTSAASPAAGATFTAVDSVTSNATGHVTALNLKTVTLPADTGDTTYTLPASGGTSAKITLTGTPASTDVVNFTSTANQVTLTESGGATITASLPSTVVAPGSLASTTTLAAGSSFSVATTSTFTGIATFTALPVIPLTPSANTDAASKGYVDSVVTGALVFQGGYNASTNSPNLDSGTNIEITKGWTYVVTVAGDFFTEAVEVGDLLIANEDMTASGGSSLAKWTTVQNNIGVATAAATDGAAVKGISGFDSQAFDVSSDGWVQQNITMAFDLGAALSTAVTHSWNTKDVMVQVYKVSDGSTVFTKVTRTVNTVTIIFSTAPASSGDYRVILTKSITAS